MRLSVVIPVYRSQDSLRPLVARLGPVLDEIAEEYELVLVNDGSPDDSWAVVCELAAEHPWIRGIDLLRNFGQHNALLSGVRAARFDVICTMDDDLQHPPEEVPKLLTRLNEGYDVVYGAPESGPHDLWRNLASLATKIALRSATGSEVARRVSAFRVFRAELRDAFAQYSASLVSLDVLLTWGSTRFSAVRVRHDSRAIGRSNYTFRKLVTHALNMMTGFSILPLQVASVLGVVFMFLGLLLSAYLVVVYFIYGRAVPGFLFLGCTVALFSGAQMLCLGIIGEYLARVHLRSMERPPFAIRQVTWDRDVQ